MTNAEYISRFGLLTQHYRSPFWEEDDIYGFLNKAQDLYVDAFAKPGNRKSYQSDQFSTDNIHTLLRTVNTAPITTGLADYSDFTNFMTTLPHDYRNYMSVVLRWSTHKTTINIQTWDEFNKSNRDSFSQPDDNENAFAVFHNNRILFATATVPDNVQLVYIKNPRTMTPSVECELPLKVHEKHLNIAYMISNLPIDELAKFEVSKDLL
jgi:hypothetical protein